jgi:peptidoglycan/LPS O-acetylase OafA/YrhL
MNSTPMPSIHWQHQTRPEQDSWQSLLIALFRGMAALQVAAGHLRAETFPSLRSVETPTLLYQAFAFATGFAHQAVVVFFLISGWLVGGSLLNKIDQPQAIRSYAIDRLTRLWTVLVPTFLLILVVGIGMDVLKAGTADFSAMNEYSALSFLGNLLGLQTVVVPNFGGNYALWSLANETWYYILFPLLLWMFRGRGILLQGACAITIALICALLPYAIVLYFSIWLLGVFFSRIRIDCGNGVRTVLVVAAVCAAVYYRFRGSNDDLVPASFIQDLVSSLPILAFLSTMHIRIAPQSGALSRLRKFAHFFSEFSFTLYVVHIPLIALFRRLATGVLGRSQLAPNAPLDYAIYLGMLMCILAVSYLSYLLFESHTFRVRRMLKKMLLGRRPKTASVATVSSDT